MKKILFINNNVKNCGVYQVGFKAMRALKDSNKYNFIYQETNSEAGFLELINQHQPEGLMFNFHPVIMPWLHKGLLDRFRYLRPTAFVHEYIAHAPREYFKYYFYSDTGAKNDFSDKPYIFVVGRLLNEYTGTYIENKVPTFGSYGFGLSIKRFNFLVKKVNEEYDEAVINLHMPNAHYGDIDSANVRAVIDSCRIENVKPNIKLNITTDFRNEQESLEFLAGNDLNAFLYAELPQHGVASSLDPALSVRRPVAVSKTYMFRHVSWVQPSICIEDSSLRQILANGIEPLEPLYKMWTKENYLKEFEDGFDTIFGDSF